MKRRIYTLIFLALILALKSRAQVNLVPNPGFEDYISCPTTYSLINLCVPWSRASWGTPDFYNTCGSFPAGAPANFKGWQNPRTGNGYSGMAVYCDGGDTKEYLQVKLAGSLIPGKKYTCEFYASLAEISNFAVKPLGMYFSPDSVFQTSYLTMYVVPQIVNSVSYVSDTAGWTKISGSFVADGHERYLIIGTFESNYTMDLITGIGPPTSSEAYYYFDDFSVVCLDCDVPNTFSPNNDGQNDYVDFSHYTLVEQIVTIYNRWGQEVFESSQNNTRWDGKDLKGNDCSDGVYYYVFHYADFINTDYNDLNRKGFIQLIR